MTRWRAAWMHRLQEWFRHAAWARVGKNAIALLVAQVGARALNLALIALVSRILGAEVLGRYLTAMTVQAIALALSDLGLNTYTTREFAREDKTPDSGLWGTVLALKMGGALFAIVVLNVLVAILGVKRQAGIAIVSLSLLPDAFNALAVARIKAWQQMEVSSGITLGVRLAYTLTGVVLLWRGCGLYVLLAVYCGVSLLGSLAFGLVLRRWQGAREPRYRRQDRLHGKGAKEARPYIGWRDVLGESMPFAVTGSVAILYTRADLLVLAHFEGDAVVGRYGMAYRLWEAMGMIPASFLDALFPELSRWGRSPADRERLRALYRRGWQIVSGGAVLLMVVAQAAAPALIALLYGRTMDADLAVGMLRVLLLAFPFTYLYLLNGHVLYAVGHQQPVTLAMVIVTALKLLLNVWVVPRASATGAAGVALASEFLLSVWLQGLVWRSLFCSREPGGEGANGDRDTCAG